METKKCLDCKLELTLDNFFKDKSRKDDLSFYCKKCHTKRISGNKEKIKNINKNIDPYEDKNRTKICLHCKKEKNITCFDRDLGVIGNIKSYCKECSKEIKDNYYKKNTAKNKNINPYLDSTKTKICEICHTEKTLIDFGIKKRHKDGLNNICKKCNNKLSSAFHKTDIGKMKRSERVKNRLKIDEKFKLSRTISKSIRHSLKQGKRKNHWENFVDYTVEDLKRHLEKRFKDGMTWKNQGMKGWHIDHIKPISSFNITDCNCEDFKKCWALNNLQPLWAVDNIKKGNKISKEYNNL